MRTLIRGGWVLGWAGDSHEVITDGVCVVDGDRVVHVGAEWDGPVDIRLDLPGRLVSPGLISTHLHAQSNAADHLYLDEGRPESQGRNYLNWQAGLEGRPRYRPDHRTSTLFGLAQCLRAGATTVVEIGSGGDPPSFVDAVEELGIRVWTGPSYRNVVIHSGDDGSLHYDWDDDRGAKGLRAALDFAERFDGAAGGRVRAILCPGHTDTCSEALLRETADHARRLDLPVTVHAAINPQELDRALERHRLTPVQLLARVGLLGPRVILGHAVFLAGHTWSRGVEAPDLQLLGDHGATVSHAPLKYLHMGIVLESLQRYLDAGVNVTIGTDITPNDVVAEMRHALLSSRVADRTFLSGTPRQVFDAATVNGARALGRDDLGRLAPGAKADVVAFDLRRLHVGAVHDPIKSLVESGTGADVEWVMVDGRVVVEGGRLTLVDEAWLLGANQEEADKLWADVPNWSWGGRTIDQAVPPAYPLR